MNQHDVDFAKVIDTVRGMETNLLAAGWVVANAVGELRSPDSTVWFSAGYVYGEYTVCASYRPRGAGPAEGQTRVRITPTLLERHPGLGPELSNELHAKWVESGGRIADVAWPPTKWAELAR